MGIYLIAGIILAILSGIVAKLILQAQNKWTDTFTFLCVGIVLGIILMSLRNGLGFWYMENWVNFSIGTIAYIYTYYSFYREFKGKFKKANIGFLHFMNLKASHGKVTIEEVTAADTLKDAFSSDMVRKINDDLNTHEGAFVGWLAVLINGLLFTGAVAGIAAQFSLGDFFSGWLRALMVNDDFKILFWALIILGGIVVLGKLFGLDKK